MCHAVIYLQHQSFWLVNCPASWGKKKLLSCYLLIEQYVMKMAVLLGICYISYSNRRERSPRGNTVRIICYNYGEKREYVGIHTQQDKLMMKLK